MKIGKLVWIIERGTAVQVKLIDFGKGPDAQVEFLDGSKAGMSKFVNKLRLYPKKPESLVKGL